MFPDQIVGAIFFIFKNLWVVMKVASKLRHLHEDGAPARHVEVVVFQVPDKKMAVRRFCLGEDLSNLQM